MQERKNNKKELKQRVLLILHPCQTLQADSSSCQENIEPLVKCDWFWGITLNDQTVSLWVCWMNVGSAVNASNARRIDYLDLYIDLCRLETDLYLTAGFRCT